MKPHTAAPLSKNKDLDTALEVLKAERLGLEKLAQTLDENFSQAVDIIHVAKKGATGFAGRVIVAGIGKSGHIARKIAATMASTGTPAFFVHAGEASHGDLGMITDHDVVLLFSNSGESAELSDLIHYTRRYNIKLIAVTANADSALGQHADLCLLLPQVPEACPNGLAPTTSTTMMLALGDALAVALLHRMGLTPEQFHAFHPGGKLGKKLLKVSDLMIPLAGMPLVRQDAKMKEALLVLTEKNLGAVIAVDEKNALRGIITDGDLKRHMDDRLLQKSVSEVMSPSPRTIDANLLAVEALGLMTKDKGKYLTSLIVTEQGKLAGLIRLQDCLQAGLV